MKKKKRLLALALMLGLTTVVAACEPNADEPVDPNAPAVDPAEPADPIDPAEAPSPTTP